MVAGELNFERFIVEFDFLYFYYFSQSWKPLARTTNMCSVLTSMATKENILVATEENTSDSTSERVDESEEVSVGSPEEPQGEDEGEDCSPHPPPPTLSTDRVINGSTTTTSALRVFRGRKRRSSADSTEEDGPLDFSSAKDAVDEDNMPPKSYFLPFKKLEMTNSEAASTAMAMASVAQKLLKPVAIAASTMQEQAAISAAKNKRKSGVAGFSIDDILSHKTAALKGGKGQKDSGHEQQQQPIVRPWDIHVGSVGGTSGSPNPSAHGAATAAATAMAAALHRKQSKQTADDAGDSPLDALFQMASKTFEGLKAKTGKKMSFFQVF